MSEANKAKTVFRSLEKVSEGVSFARDLASEPANELYPETFAKETRQLKKLGVSVQILTQAQMEKLGMGSLLSVSQGSDKPPRLVIMKWQGAGRGAKDKRPVALVGKGVTFDSGGISLKPGAGMGDMKYDMSGAAAVTGAMMALAGRKAKANVVGLIGLVENMPSGKATRPGDIVRSASGKTIEILNTDAEGRRVLADVVWYAQKYIKPRCIVDLATLTGAMPVALGQEYAGLFSNADKLAQVLDEAGNMVDEKLWRMPLCANFNKLLDSKVADMKDIGGRYAGSATGAHFIGRFIEKGMDWAHIDIAGVAYDNKDNVFAPQGPTGFGVKMLDRFVSLYAEK
jgi:leucyl aminopeptidase